jgi:hypothetical protein
MRPLSTPELLDVWERGLSARPFEQALALLSVASPESSPAALSRVTIGQRDTSLFRLREWAFGPELVVQAACPVCHELLDMVLPVADLCPLGNSAHIPEVSVCVEDYELRCRLPDSEDLITCAALEVNLRRQTLFTRCVIEASYQGEPIGAEQLPSPVVQAAIDRIAAAEPLADIRIDLTCPACEHRWSEPFDVVSFFWAEIDAWARRLFREVHTLASAYGWNESEVLALSPMRRQIYLAMAEI